MFQSEYVKNSVKNLVLKDGLKELISLSQNNFAKQLKEDIFKCKEELKCKRQKMDKLENFPIPIRDRVIQLFLQGYSKTQLGFLFGKQKPNRVLDPGLGE